MKFAIWIVMMGLCILCFGCATTGSNDKTPGLDQFPSNGMPDGSAQAAEFARKTY